MVDAIAAGVDAGPVDGTVDPDLAAQAFSGAAFYARLMTATPLSATAIDRLITTVLGHASD